MNKTGLVTSLATSAGTVTEKEYYLVTIEPYQQGQKDIPPNARILDENGLHSTSSIPIQKKSGDMPVTKQRGLHNDSRAKWASVLLALLGFAVLGSSFIIGYGTMPSLLLSLEGVSLFVISIIFIFVSQGKLVRGEVNDAANISSTELVNAFLAPIAGESKGIYIPSGKAGSTKLFIPASDGALIKAYEDAGAIKYVNISGMDGLYITPPGYGLLSYAKSLGATFTDEGMEAEIKDVLVNGTELVSRVEVDRKADRVCVHLDDVADTVNCRTIRQKSPEACCQAGCPLCSFVACMVAEGTGKPTMVNDVTPGDKGLDITYKLL